MLAQDEDCDRLFGLHCAVVGPRKAQEMEELVDATMKCLGRKNFSDTLNDLQEYDVMMLLVGGYP